MISTLILIIILVCSTVYLLFDNMTIFNKKSNFQTVPTPQEQEIANEEFMKAYEKVKKHQEEKEKNEVPYTWNPNNTLESMKLEPCLANNKDNSRMTCYTAPAWWYPKDKYDPNKFRSVYYGDYYNPIYNYLGNAQEMYWDFKSVKDTFSII